MKAKSAKVLGVMFAEGILWKEDVLEAFSESSLALGWTDCTCSSMQPLESSSWETSAAIPRWTVGASRANVVVHTVDECEPGWALSGVVICDWSPTACM